LQLNSWFFNFLWRFFNFHGTSLVPKIKTNSYESVSSMSPLLTKLFIIMSRSDVGLFQLLRASRAVLSMWCCKVKWDEEKSKYAGLAQENGFAQHTCTVCSGLWTCRKEYNKLDLTAAHCFWLAHHNDSSRLFAIVVLHLYAVPVSVLRKGCKNYITKLACEKYFCREQIGLSTAGDALTHAQHWSKPVLLRMCVCVQGCWIYKMSQALSSG